MNSNLNPNTRSMIGDNQAPAYAENVTAQMERDYKALTEGITELLEKARQQPARVETDEAATAMGLVVKELREADKRAEAYRTSEGEPHRLAVDAVNSFFFRLREKIGRRDRKGKPGAADILQARIDAYLDEKAAREEARRAEEARLARQRAIEAEERAAAERRRAEEARLAAERARKPETTAAKVAVADAAEASAGQAAIEATVAAEQAQAAHVETLAKPAELARTRGDGVILTQARQPFAIVTDRSKLDMAALWPFFTDAEVEKALRGWAKVTGHTKQMNGAEIGFGRKGITR